MKDKLEKLNPSVVFVIILFLFAIPLSYYFIYWIPQREAQLSERYLRITAMMSEQFETRAENIRQTIVNTNIEISNQHLMDIKGEATTEVVKELETKLKSILKLPNLTCSLLPNSPLKQHSQRGRSEAYMEETYSRDIHYNRQDKRFEIKVDKVVGNLKGNFLTIPFKAIIDIKDFVEVWDREEFEDVFIFDTDGNVHYQRNRYTEPKRGIENGLRVSSIKTVFAPPGANPKKTKNNEAPAAQTGSGIPSDTFHSHVLDIRVAKNNYKLFFQPLPLNFLKKSSSYDNGGAKNDSSAGKWYIAGMLSSEAFRKRSFKISKNILLIFSLLLMLALIAFPLAKFWLIGPRDRFRWRDILFISLSMLLGIPLLIWMILTLTIYFIDADTHNRDLETLSSEIQANFNLEMTRAHKQLKFLVNERETYLIKFNETNREPKQNLLQRMNNNILIYPYFDLVYTIDEKGNQIYKNRADNQTVAFLNVESRDYFRAIKNKHHWFFNGEPVMLEPTYSRSTGLYEINLAIPITASDDAAQDSEPPGETGGINLRVQMEPETPDREMTRKPQTQQLQMFSPVQQQIAPPPETGSDTSNEYKPAFPMLKKEPAAATDIVAGMSFRPLSVMNPVLPYGYGFAVINREGKVLFHSDSRLNSYENFFRECSEPGIIRSAQFSRAAVQIHSNYQGKAYEMVVSPIKDIPWTLVVFRNRDLEESRNLERTLITMVPYLAYLLLLAAVMLLACLFSQAGRLALVPSVRQRHRKLRWLWPDSEIKDIYPTLAALNLFTFAFLALHLWLIPRQSFTAIVVPMLAITACYTIIIRKLKESDPDSKRVFFREYSAPLAVTAALVLVLILFHKRMFEGFGWVHVYIFLPLPVYVYFIMNPDKPVPLRLPKKFKANAYPILLQSVLVLLIVFPSLVFFKNAYSDERVVALKHQQISLARELVQWDENLRDNYLIYSQENNIDEGLRTGYKHLGQYFPASIASDQLKDYDSGNILPDQLLPGTALAPWTDDDYLHQVRGSIPLTNTYFKRTRYLHPDQQADIIVAGDSDTQRVPILWKQLKTDTGKALYLYYNQRMNPKETIHLLSYLPKTDWGKSKHVLILLTGIFLLMLFLSVAIYGTVKFISRAIFLVDLEPLDDHCEQFSPEPLPEGNHFIFGKYTPIKDKNRLEINWQHIDPATHAPETKLKDLKTKQWVILSNFEAHMHDHNLNTQKLETLEGLLGRDDLNVLVFSTFEPIQYFALPPKEKDAAVDNAKEMTRRWKRVMKQMELKYPQERVNDGTEKKETTPKDYDGIWYACSLDEKLLLIQLDQEGLVNIKNKTVISALIQRGIIQLSPLQFRDKGFRHYVGHAEDTGAIMSWNKNQADSGWTKLKRPFLSIVTGTLLFLVITQPGLLNSWMVLIPAVSGGVPAFLKLFEYLSGTSKT